MVLYIAIVLPTIGGLRSICIPNPVKSGQYIVAIDSWWVPFLLIYRPLVLQQFDYSCASRLGLYVRKNLQTSAVFRNYVKGGKVEVSRNQGGQA